MRQRERERERAASARSTSIALLSHQGPLLTNHEAKNAALAEGIAKAHPLKRVGEGADSASLAKFLITDESSWVTGQVIGVDGGRSTLS